MSLNGRNIAPPNSAERFLSWFLKVELLEEILGDLYEYHEELLDKPNWKRKLYYWFHVFHFLRPFALKNLEKTPHLNQYDMFKNYLKVAFRIIRKEKSFAFINIFGLALAITCSLFIYLWVQDEVQFNSHLAEGDRVCYIMHNEQITNGEINTYNSSPFPLKKLLEDKYPSIEQVAITSWGNWMAFERGETLMEKSGIDASPELFEMFEVPFLAGHHEAMKTKPQTIAISESFAAGFFGEDWQTQEVVGESMGNEWGESYELVGVFEDFPKNTTLKFDFLIPHEIRLSKNHWLKGWGNNASQMYVKLKEGVTLEQANLNIKNAIIDNRDDERESIREIFLQPFSEKYLHTRVENGKIAGGRIEYVRLLSVAAILILLLASINFMNMATARSGKRSKETGVRKVLGAFQSSLKAQFLTESILITSFGLIVALLMVFALLPQFNAITGKEVSIGFLTPEFILALLAFVLVLGFFSGLYPAFYLSSLKTMVSLKGGHKHNKFDVFFRKGLVVFQFMITIVMITGAITVFRQVSYIQTKNIGLDRSNLINSWTHEIHPVDDYQVFKTELLNRPGIESVTLANQNMMEIGNSTSSVSWEGKGEDEIVEFHVFNTSPDFIPTLRIELKAGRNFDWNLKTDTANYIINEAAEKLMRMDNAVGEKMEMWDLKGRVIGVVKDFHNASLHRAIEPLIIRYDQSNSWRMLTRTKPGQTEEALASLEEVYHIFNPKRDFTYQFVDELYNEQYRSELMVKDLSFYFTVLAIIISCLGLFALVAYTAEQRTKEIGIRKVLGATVTNILQLLSKEFVLLLVISLAIAIPLAYYIMSGWLDGFAYRIELNWWLFALAGMVTVLISYSIIGSHAVRSALANPVDSLKDE